MPAWLNGRRAARCAAATLVATSALVGTTTTAWSAPETDRAGVAKDGWRIEPVAGGYEITLELPAPLPVREAAPTLEVDGEPVGLAREGASGRSLSVVTSDPRVLEARTVTPGWQGEERSQRPAPPASSAPAPDVPDAAALLADPAAEGGYTVARADYDLGSQAVDLPEIGGIKGELRAAVYYPQEAVGERPVVVFQHGRHTSCSLGTPNPDRYPCGPGQVDIPSYLGYDAPAETLASHGYVVVSVSANAVNSNDNQLAIDYGATARGGLILSHLDLLARANRGQALDPALQGRLDLDHVGLMGHSRGGDGVVRAALMNEERRQPFGIESVLALAPVDFGRLSLPNVPTYIMLPYCDGDVVNLQGQHFYEDSRHAFDDDVLRATGLFMGANHNFFNTVWTPGLYPYAVSDDWGFQDRTQTNPVCGGAAESRLTAAEQYAVGDAYISGWFRLTMGGEDAFLPMYDGSGAVPASAGPAEVHTVASAPSSVRADLAPLDTVAPNVRATGATATYCASLSGRPFPQQVPACADSATVTSSQVPHWSPMRFAPSAPAGSMLNLTWTAAGGGLTVDVPGTARDFRRFEKLTFRAAPDQHATAAQDLTVTVVDGRGAVASVPVSQVSPALTPLPGDASPLRKILLRTVDVPVSDLTGLDLADVRQVRISTVGTSGGVYLSDLAVTGTGVGQAERLKVPALYVSDAVVNEGTGPGTASVAVRLTKTSKSPVTTYVEANAGTGAAQRNALPLTIPAGATCAVFEVPLSGNTSPATAPSAWLTVTAAAVRGAYTGDAFGRLTIREDDAVVAADGTVGTLEADPGAQGDLCAGSGAKARP